MTFLALDALQFVIVVSAFVVWRYPRGWAAFCLAVAWIACYATL